MTPKPTAGWTPIFKVHPRIALPPKPEAPDRSWWADPTLSWEQFSEVAAQQIAQMSASKMALSVNTVSRFSE